MNHREIDETVQRYDARLDEFGESEQALGWGAKGRSNLRFHVLASRWNVAGSRVLDFGCGFGGFYDFLKRAGTPVSYVGIDLNPRFIRIAQQRHPEATFIVGSVDALAEAGPVDYIVSSGVFNHRLDDNMGFIESAFKAFDRFATRGFACNFLSDRVDYPLDYTFHASPEGMLALAYRYSRNVVLRNDYMPFEFTVFVDKAASIDPALTVYEDYVRFV
ncbi:MAG TPA: class I SAM-dependent methyltransferase [Candidatus Aquilonibacter sp.]|nr:class I SAM-dependent methyltransferase [Candidatus Aquilonibacter sp.]